MNWNYVNEKLIILDKISLPDPGVQMKDFSFYPLETRKNRFKVSAYNQKKLSKILAIRSELLKSLWKTN